MFFDDNDDEPSIMIHTREKLAAQTDHQKNSGPPIINLVPPEMYQNGRTWRNAKSLTGANRKSHLHKCHLLFFKKGALGKWKSDSVQSVGRRQGITSGPNQEIFRCCLGGVCSVSLHTGKEHRVGPVSELRCCCCCPVRAREDCRRCCCVAGAENPITTMLLLPFEQGYCFQLRNWPWLGGARLCFPTTLPTCSSKKLLFSLSCNKGQKKGKAKMTWLVWKNAGECTGMRTASGTGEMGATFSP